MENNNKQGAEERLWHLLNVSKREPTEKEREYLAAWASMKFTDDVIRYAYEYTVFKKMSLNWPYMNYLLVMWHKKGLRALDDIMADVSRGELMWKDSRRSPKQVKTKTQMRLVVNKLPRDGHDCMFFRDNGGFSECALTGGACEHFGLLAGDNSCDGLITLEAALKERCQK
ncbi:MAG: DnaD domain protein [Oscillospiraceae bacterium]|nr:DnaD domain protein [Oscillospiraceae bacterium]